MYKGLISYFCQFLREVVFKPTFSLANRFVVHLFTKRARVLQPAYTFRLVLQRYFLKTIANSRNQSFTDTNLDNRLFIAGETTEQGKSNQASSKLFSKFLFSLVTDIKCLVARLKQMKFSAV